MDEDMGSDYLQGREALRKLCELTIDLRVVGFRWTCEFTADEAATVARWLALAGRGAAGLRVVADQVAAAFRVLSAGAGLRDVLVVDRYVETAVFLLDEITDSYPEHAAQVAPVAELLFDRLYAGA